MCFTTKKKKKKEAGRISMLILSGERYTEGSGAGAGWQHSQGAVLKASQVGEKKGCRATGPHTSDSHQNHQAHSKCFLMGTQAMCEKRSPMVRSRDISRDKARGGHF